MRYKYKYASMHIKKREKNKKRVFWPFSQTDWLDLQNITPTTQSELTLLKQGLKVGTFHPTLLVKS